MYTVESPANAHPISAWSAGLYTLQNVIGHSHDGQTYFYRTVS